MYVGVLAIYQLLLLLMIVAVVVVCR